ncbi:hypothetical protein IU433_18855 [Nocardia puris]|uniref:Lipoprotein n=1 Tax=Nocardia puris TaxID=208602 RepID=A0A366DFL4_9NOCA|nr:hypothetical protein [Nocardia puris]MBF6212507.1 hypothetical protein [Nocardia puris]MBF6366754.1 hypothetical protein [Nocardia puris]MBF6461096.1 hypothetical protein [Nocardia puris]RBO88867.1 hypothetical protein DFR74_10892 [Nocardia puris]
MRFGRTLCIALITATTLTACGDSGDDGPATPTIDIAALDSGNFPTEPRDVEATRRDDSGYFLEAMRIGAVTPVAVDIDPRLTYQRRYSRYDRRNTPTSAPTLFSVPEEFEFGQFAEGFIAGWEANGERRSTPLLGKEIQTYNLRFGTAAQAETAARGLADEQQKVYPGVPVPIDGFPGAVTRWSHEKRYLDVWLPHGEMLLGVHLQDPVTEPADPTALAEIAKNAFTKQIEMLKSYEPTPVDQLASLPVDIDGMLSRTLPTAERDRPGHGHSTEVIATDQAALHSEKSPALAKGAFADAGVDLVASDGARVYRTRDAASTVRLIAALTAMRADGYKEADSPRDMPGVECFDMSDPKGSWTTTPPTCFLAYDRYVAIVQGINLQEVHQKAAAQYKLLAHDR